jgi:hypothetical protein
LEPLELFYLVMESMTVREAARRYGRSRRAIPALCF